MKNEEIIKIVEIKNGNKWEISYSTKDLENIYKSLSDCLIAKKINCCAYIRSIKRTNLYNGFQKIIVYQNNGVKITFVVPN